VGHHGSRTSSTPNFLKAVDFDIAVIPCGVDNRYDHPHQQTLENLASLGIAVYGTDLSGDIIIETDGTNCNVIRARADERKALRKILHGS